MLMRVRNHAVCSTEVHTPDIPVSGILSNIVLDLRGIAHDVEPTPSSSPYIVP